MSWSNGDRDRLIRQARDSGESLDAIAERFDLTRERVRQVCVRSDVMDAMEETELWGMLSTAARRLGVSERSAVRAYNIVTSSHAVRVGRYDSNDYVQVPFGSIPPSRWHEIATCGDKVLAVLGEAFEYDWGDNG